jgi:hypothetical protein
MRIRLHFAVAVLAGIPAAFAQSGTDPKPLVIGGFENEGSVTTGYRFTDVHGYQPKYQELFNLNSGLRLLDLTLFGKAGAESRFADSYSLNVSGLGGEPFSTGQLNVRKSRVYDLRVNFRQTHYYWNRNDSVLLNGGNSLTSNHDWATVRKLGSANLLVHATKNLRLSFEYYRNTRNGVAGTTRPADYFGSASTWGSFARANPYYLVAPFNQSANRVTGGLDYTHRDWSVHYRMGYQSFEDSVDGRNPLSPERSINVDDANTARELLNNFAWKDSRRLHTPVSEFSYTGRLSSGLEARGGYIFYRYSGPASLDMSFDGAARTSVATVTAPYATSTFSQAHVTEPNHVIDQGFSYRVKEWWRILLDYRYSRFTVDSEASYRTVNGPSTITGEASSDWRVSSQTLDMNMIFTPASSLLVRTGVRLLKSDIIASDDGVVDLQRTRRIKTVWPIASMYYQPSKMFSVRADIEHVVNGTSYTRVTPHIDTGGRFIVRFRPTEKLYFDDTAIVRNRQLLQSDFHSRIHSNAFTANYEFNPRYTVFAGFSYDSLFASNYVNFLRGTAPFTNVSLRDQTVERLWHGGLRVIPLPRLGASFSGNFIRVTGVGEIAGEAPIYGPMTSPYASGSLWYDFPKLGRLTAQLQRTYYTEEIVTGNNFSANMLMIAWTRSF